HRHRPGRPRQFRGCGAALAGNGHQDLGSTAGRRVAPLPVRAKREKEAPMGNWQLDPYHTQVEFSAKHFGMMTVRGHFAEVAITRPVPLEVTRYGELNDPGMMGHRISYGARGQINRTDFGVGTDMVLDGKLVVSNEIQIVIEGELVEQSQAAQATSG